MVTSTLLGIFKRDPRTRAEFMGPSEPVATERLKASTRQNLAHAVEILVDRLGVLKTCSRGTAWTMPLIKPTRTAIVAGGDLFDSAYAEASGQDAIESARRAAALDVSQNSDTWIESGCFLVFLEVLGQSGGVVLGRLRPRRR